MGGGQISTQKRYVRNTWMAPIIGGLLGKNLHADETLVAICDEEYSRSCHVKYTRSRHV